MLTQTDNTLLYEAAKEQNAYCNSFFTVLQAKQTEDARYKILSDALASLSLPRDAEYLNAFAVRLCSLKEDALKNLLTRDSVPEIPSVLKKAYRITVEFYTNLFSQTINSLEGKGISPHILHFLRAFYKLGKSFDAAFHSWDAILIQGANKQLESMFSSKKEIIDYLDEKGLLFDGGDTTLSRSYCALVYKDEDFVLTPYGKAFAKELASGIEAIDEICSIKGLSETFKNYFSALKDALLQEDQASLLVSWQNVDAAWMEVQGELQPTHPFEYYEDIYRHSVVLELDLRIQTPKNSSAIESKNDIYALLDTYGDPESPLYAFVRSSLERAYVNKSLPLLYFGAMMQGLFSAQVIPNDETISSRYGKKIFGYPEMVYAGAIARPKMLLEKEILSDDLYDAHYALLDSKQRWMDVYEVSTIGHELGHILWVDEASEGVMNRSGEFKNIEEFKATSSGICAHILQGGALIEDVMLENIIRSMKLVAQKESDEYRPYYSEAMIHLSILFESGMLEFQDGKLWADFSSKILKNSCELYLAHYDKLVKTYVNKSDAKEYLFDYVRYEGRNLMPIDSGCYDFVSYYYKRYQEIGAKLC